MVEIPEVEPYVGCPDDQLPAVNAIADRVDRANSWGQASYWAAMAALWELAQKRYELDFADVTTTDTPPPSGINPVKPSAPIIEDINVQQATFEGTRADAPDISFDVGTVPDWNIAPPNFLIPDVPEVVWPVLSAVLPSEIDSTIPVAPTISLPAPPVITDVPIPSAPSIQEIAFEGTMPSMDLTPPEPMFAWNEAEYDSDLLQALQVKLLTDVQNGGTGLGADIEAAIWARALSRQAVENEQTYDEALNFFSSRGFALPPGALVSRLTEVRNKIDQRNEDLNNDILIQESKLAQENTHFVITAGIQLEKNLMDLYNARNQRLFEAAKYTVEAALIIYQAKVEAYKAQLEAYKTLAQVYEARVRAEIAKVEIFKAQIEGAKVSLEIQMAYVEAYKAQLQGVLTLVEIYKAEMEGAKIVSEINKIRIEGYKAQIDAYSSEVGAITARFNAYQSQIAGEVAKADMYKAQSQAYVAQVDGFKAQAQIQVAEAEVEVQANRALVETYNADVTKYRADVERFIAQAEATAKEQGYRIQAFDSETRLYQVDVDTLTKVYMTQVEEAKAQWDTQIKQADVNMQGARALYEFEAENLKATAQIHAQLGVAALTSISASAHLSFSQNMADSSSKSGSGVNSSSSTSFSDRTKGVGTTSESTQHIYTHTS